MGDSTREHDVDVAAIEVRPIHENDVHNGFFDVLAQLTSAPPIHAARFAELVAEQRRHAQQQTLVAVDARGNVRASGSVFIEPKFIRGGRPCAHVEDVVVCRTLRGSGVGRRIIAQLVAFASARGCYKVVLDCAPSNVAFYEKCGFRSNELQMALYL